MRGLREEARQEGKEKKTFPSALVLHVPLSMQTLSRYVSSCDLARSVLDGGGAMDPERCLSELTGLLHPNHFLYARVARRAFHHR